MWANALREFRENKTVTECDINLFCVKKVSNIQITHRSTHIQLQYAVILYPKSLGGDVIGP